jgi:hypothetical protein
MLTIPVQPLPNQQLQVQLGTQACTIELVQGAYCLFMNLYVSGTLIIAGVFCQNLNRIVRDLYLGFSGDLAFFDTQGSSDPVFTGLGSRFLLVYLAPSDLPSNEG